MNKGRLSVSLCSLLCLLSLAAWAEEYPPVTPEELKMTSESLAPGAAAIILYRQVDRDDREESTLETNFVRIKILKEEGRKYADVEIPYDKGSSSEIKRFHARTIHPDGSGSEFNGKPFDKLIVKAKGLKYMAKTFTLPDVQVGSVIEYSYTLVLPEGGLYNSRWILNEDLFTKHAKFSLKPFSFAGEFASVRVRWSWHNLPPGTKEPQQGKDNIITLDAENIPAFQTEDYMPPEGELKARVDFTYTSDPEMDPVKYWKNRAKELDSGVERFAGKRKAMEQAVNQLVNPNDSPEAKVQKIYERVQRLRNLSAERERTAQEQKRDKQKDNSNVDDVWKHQYGYGNELNWLFLALCRAAGLEAYPVFVADRENYFFDPVILDAHKLDYDLVLVKVNGKEEYFDPGVSFTPFGLLMWQETGVQGLRLDKDGGAWITTPMPKSSNTQLIRRADLTLSENGDIEGKLTLTFTGLMAMQLRREERNEDDTDRKKTLEDEAKSYIPATSEVELTNKPDWTSSSAPLIAEFKMKVDGWASGAGRKAMLPMALFSADEKNVFSHADRVHPIYFEYPTEKDDDITIALPAGWQISSVPKEMMQDGRVITYSLRAENNKTSVHITRKFSTDILLMDQTYYGALRNFYQIVRTADEQQILLQPGGTTASN